MNFRNFKNLVAHPLISGSAIIFIGSMTANVIGYFFNLAMGRLLSVSDYGILAALMSILGVFTVFSTTVGTTMTRFTAFYIGKGKEEMVKILFKKGTIWIGTVNLFIFIILLILSKPIAGFLHISNLSFVFIILITLFIGFMGAIPFGILSGLMQFIPLSIIGIITALTKIIIGVLLVLWGFKIFGALTAVLLSSILGYLFVFIFLNKFTKNKKQADIHLPTLKKEIISYSMPVFFSALGITLFSSLDVILVKHFFQPIAAGQYAALSLMGKSIFFAVGPIITVFFPLIIQKREKGENIEKILILAIVLVGIPSIILCIIYFLFPGFVVNIFFPAKIYKSLAPYLGLFSIFVFLFTLISLFNSLYLTFAKTKVFVFTIIGSVLQVFAIIIFHKNIYEVIMDLIIVSGFLLIGLIIYYPFIVNKSKS